MGKSKESAKKKGRTNQIESSSLDLEKANTQAGNIKEVIGDDTGKNGEVVAADGNVTVQKRDELKLKGTKWGDSELSEEGEESEDDSSDSEKEDSGCDSLEENQSESEDEGTVSAVPEIAPSPPEMEKKPIVVKKKPTFASLFAGNRIPSNGSKLQQMERKGGPVQFQLSDIEEDQHFKWNCCLVGYFEGRFPGKAAVQQVQLLGK